MQTKLSNILYPATSFYVTETETETGRGTSIHCVLVLRLYTRRVKRKLNLLVRSPTEVNNNNIKSNQIKSQWPQENTLPRSSRVLCTRAVYADQALANVDVDTDFHSQEKSESARQNTNSFVDTLASDSKADTADTAAGRNAHTTGGIDGEKTLTGGHEHEKGETGFNKDAEAIGGAALDGADSLAEKAKRKMYGI